MQFTLDTTSFIGPPPSISNHQLPLRTGFEWTGSTSTMVKYSSAGSQRLAMRTGIGTGTTNLTYLLGDHLGSTSLTFTADTYTTATHLYKPWGEVRYQSGTLPTKYTFTGQYSHTADFGLMYYVARWYDPVLGRFAQADTMIPSASQGTQAWDRFAYVNNNPVRYNDPTGHCIGPLAIICVAIIEAAPVVAEFVGIATTAYIVADMATQNAPELNGEQVNLGIVFVPGPVLPLDIRPDLYRGGDTNFPNLGLKTPDKPYSNGIYDIAPDANGMVGPGSGGLSTSTEVKPNWKSPWVYPSDAPSPEGINIFQDNPTEDPNHWLWEPAWEMPLADFKQYLKKTLEFWTPAE